ncbi:MAG: hypothetical protein WC861_06130 [Candidatus Micrarchaeia archaeon]|jgi:hypothetical protein
MNRILQPIKPDAAAENPQRIDHIIMLRARAISSVYRIIGANQPAYAKDALPIEAVVRAEAKIDKLMKDCKPEEADALKAKLRAIESYNDIIIDNIAHPQKDVEITELPPDVVRSLPKGIGVPIVDDPYDYTMTAADFRRVRLLVEGADSGIGGADSARRAGERMIS